jgi:hypothetical protein
MNNVKNLMDRQLYFSFLSNLDRFTLSMLKSETYLRCHELIVDKIDQVIDFQLKDEIYK